MLHPSTKKLIDKLSEMTRKQRVSWIEGENGTIVHDTEGYRVVLTPEPHGVVLTDAVGREIETCTPEEIADEKDAAGRPYSQFIGELFREAHRHARGTEKAIRTLLAGLEAADEPQQTAAAAPPPEPEPETEPESLTDETISHEGETAITAAVATLADQINATAPMAGPEVMIAPEPDVISAGTDPAPEPEPELVSEPEPAPLPAAYAETEESAEEEAEPELETAPEETMEEAAALATPEAEPEAEAVSEPVPETEPEQATLSPAPEPEPAPAPSALQQRFSLSGIPYGVGFAGTQTLAPPEEKPVETTPPDPRPLIIDGTEDLPQDMPHIEAEPSVPPLPQSEEESQDEEAPPAIPRRFNPWN